MNANSTMRTLDKLKIQFQQKKVSADYELRSLTFSTRRQFVRCILKDYK
jgi:hypothetical protein